MSAMHITLTNLSKAANTAANVADSTDPLAAAEGGALPFALLLGEEAAALLGEKIAAESTELSLNGEATSVEATELIDPAGLGLQLNLPPAQMAPLQLPAQKAGGEQVVDDAAIEATPRDIHSHSTSLKAEPVALKAATDKETLAAAIAADAPKFEMPKVVNAAETPTALAALQTTNATSRLEQAAAPVQLHQPVGSQAWNTELGHNLSVLIKGDQARASLMVTPPEMGPIEVQIDLSGDQATINFAVQQTDTRQALENALPRLREMLAESGIDLGQSQVNQQSAGQGREQSDLSRGQSAFGSSADKDTEGAVQVRTRVGLVDTFA